MVNFAAKDFVTPTRVKLMVFVVLFLVTTSINRYSFLKDTSTWQAVPEQHGVPAVIYNDWWWGGKGDFPGMENRWQFDAGALVLDAAFWYAVACASIFTCGKLVRK